MTNDKKSKSILPAALPFPRVPTIWHTNSPAPSMNTATTTTATPGAIKATLNPTCYARAHSIDLSEAGTGTPKGQESLHVLLLCLRGITTFCWAASRRILERMLLAYLQSAVNPILRSLIANLTAITCSGGSVPTGASAAEEAWALNGKEASVIWDTITSAHFFLSVPYLCDKCQVSEWIRYGSHRCSLVNRHG